MTTTRRTRATGAEDATARILRLAEQAGAKILGVRLPGAATGVYRIEIRGFRPALLNEYIGKHWAVGARLKARDAKALTAARLLNGVPIATGKRRVSVVVTDRFRRMPDPDSILKAFLDGLTKSGLIVDDSEAFCAWDRPQFAKGDRMTVIELEDVKAPEGEGDAN